MRLDGFLRTPIRASHQDRLLNLQIREVDVAGNPDPANPHPQTLEIAFTRDAAITEIQIVPLWSCLLGFRPDPGVTPPADPAAVTEAAFSTWNATGELILRQADPISSELVPAFGKHIPVISPPPDTVVYSRVALTKEFLFTTLPSLPKLKFKLNGVVVVPDDPLFHQKRTIAFLLGKTRVFCLHHDTDAALDAATKPMPGVLLGPAGVETVLRITAATIAPEALDPAWFAQVPAYDGISGEDLVPVALNSFADQLLNPRHPSHSVVPVQLIFQGAAPQAFASDEPPTTPLRAALSQALPGGKTYRRVEVVRPPVPGPPNLAPQRPYPCYKLCWKAVGEPTLELRLPLSGQAYLPLADKAYTFWVIPRSQDSALHTVGDHVRLSLRAAGPGRIIGPPETSVTLNVTGKQDFTLYSSLRKFDSAYVWAGYVAATPARAPLKTEAQANWNARVLDWYIDAPRAPPRATRIQFAPLYGMFRESAGRHGLSPEFLQVAFFGEAGGQVIDAQAAFDPGEVISCFDFLGLDLILYRTGRLRLGDPPVPPEVPLGAAEERAEYAFNLVANGYLDAATAATVTWAEEVKRVEGGGDRTLQIANVAGWASAIELFAAELHARLDEMQEYCATHVPPIPVDSEAKRRFLAYVRFNTKPTTAKAHADRLDQRVRAWVGAEPPDNLNAHFNAIQRIAVTEWHDVAGAYR